MNQFVRLFNFFFFKLNTDWDNEVFSAQVWSNWSNLFGLFISSCSKMVAWSRVKSFYASSQRDKDINRDHRSNKRLAWSHIDGGVINNGYEFSLFNLLVLPGSNHWLCLVIMCRVLPVSGTFWSICFGRLVSFRSVHMIHHAHIINTDQYKETPKHFKHLYVSCWFSVVFCIYVDFLQ